MRDGRVNGYAADWCEIAAANRYRLERVDKNHCDAYTTESTPVLSLGPNIPVEMKACMAKISNGHGNKMKGRFGFHRGNHRKLLDEGGQYALPVYREVDDSIIVLRCGLFPGTMIHGLLDEFTRSRQKLSWGKVYRHLVERRVHQ